MSDERLHLEPDATFDPAAAMSQLSDHFGQLAIENAYLRRTLAMVQSVLPYPKAKRGGCAKARRSINEALLGLGE